MYGATLYGFVIAFVMTYRSATKYWSAESYCERSFKSCRSLGYRFLLYGLIVLIYISLRTILAIPLHMSWEPIFMGAIPLFPPLILLARLCGWASRPPFVEFYTDLLLEAEYDPHEYLGSCFDSTPTLIYIVVRLSVTKTKQKIEVCHSLVITCVLLAF